MFEKRLLIFFKYENVKAWLWSFKLVNTNLLKNNILFEGVIRNNY